MQPWINILWIPLLSAEEVFDKSSNNNSNIRITVDLQCERSPYKE
jgi:hypothetical protein